ncbi:MAG: thioredoxin family protein [Oligoflexales bacterium]
MPKFFFVLLLTQFFLYSHASYGDPSFYWKEKSPSQAFSESKTTNKPILLFWSASWCQPCMIFKDKVLNHPAVLDKMSNFVPIYLDADAEFSSEWLKRYSITSYPTIMFIDKNGQIIEKINAGIEVDEYMQLLDRISSIGSLRTADEIIDSVISNGEANSISEVGRILSYGWCYSKEAKPFTSIDQKKYFFSKLYSSKDLWPKSAEDRIYYQYIYLLSILDAPITETSRKELVTHLDKIIDSPSRLSNLIWDLPFNLPDFLSILKITEQNEKYFKKIRYHATSDLMEDFHKIILWKGIIQKGLNLTSDELLAVKELLTSVFNSLEKNRARTLEIKTVGELAIEIGLFDIAQLSIDSLVEDEVVGSIFKDLQGYAYEVQGDERSIKFYMESAKSERGWMSRLMRTRKVLNSITRSPYNTAKLSEFLIEIFRGIPDYDEPVFLKSLNNTLKIIYSLPNSNEVSEIISSKLSPKNNFHKNLLFSLNQKIPIQSRSERLDFSAKVGVLNKDGTRELTLQVITDPNWKTLVKLPNGKPGVELIPTVEGKVLQLNVLREPRTKKIIQNQKKLEIYPAKYRILYDFAIDEKPDIPINFLVKVTLCNQICKQQTISINGKSTFNDGYLGLSLEDEKHNFSTNENVDEESLNLVGNDHCDWSMDWYNDSIIFMIILAFIGGLILNGMPCVLPVVALKVQNLADWKSISSSNIRRFSLFYCLGIMFSFIVLAATTFIMKSLGQAVGWGLHFQSPQFLYFILLVMFILTLSMFGLIYVPINFTSKIFNTSFSSKYLNEFFNGVIATILSTPCTAPFLGTAVMYGIGSDSFLKMLFIFIGIGLGLGFPFWIFMIFPGLVEKLPKPGLWMEKLKYVCAIIMLISCAWILSSLFLIEVARENIFLILLSIILIYSAIHGKKILRKAWILSISAFLFTIITAANLKKQQDNDGPKWKKWSPDVSQINIAKNNMILVNVTANWCLTCKWNEQLVFSSSKFNKLVNELNIELYKADYTEKNSDISDFLREHNKAGVPAYLLINHRHEFRDLGEILTIDSVAKAMRDFSET